MNKNQLNRRPDYRWPIAVFFLLLALSFIFDIWANKREIRKNPLVDQKYFSTESIRQPMIEPLLVKDGLVYRCNDCHQHIEPSNIQKSFFSAHKDVILKHGANNYCTTCHSSNDREFLIDIHGDNVPFSKSEVTCLKCHGEKYRDWLQGVHGRMNGYWDKTKGEVKKLTCVACHDPHQPKFKAIEPSPSPVIFNYLDKLTIKDNIHE